MQTAPHNRLPARRRDRRVEGRPRRIREAQGVSDEGHGGGGTGRLHDVARFAAGRSGPRGRHGAYRRERCRRRRGRSVQPRTSQRARQDAFLPKPPVVTQAVRPGDVPISPMPLAERLRREVVPRHGICSTAPAADALLLSGNGAMSIETACHPYSEQIVFRHESLFAPRKRPFESPKIAGVFSQVRQLVLDGKYEEAARLGIDEWRKTPMPSGMGGFGGLSFTMRIETPGSESVKDYLRTADFESTELKVHWTDARGEWTRQVIRVAARQRGGAATHRPKWKAAERPDHHAANRRARSRHGGGLTRPGAPAAPAQTTVQQDFTAQRLILKGVLDASVNNSGFASVTRVVLDGGSARMDGDTLVVENAASLMLLTRIEHFPDYSEDRVEAVRQSLERIAPDYAALLDRARTVQAEMLNRVTVDFGGASQYGLSSEELLSDQRSSPGYCGAFLEKLFDMCRYWFILTSGKYCSDVGPDQRQHQPADRRLACWAITAKARMPTSTGWRACSRTSAPTPRTSSACAAPTIPSRRPKTRASIRCSTTPAPPTNCGRILTGFPPAAGACARSGIATWSRGTWISSAIAWCRLTRIWRCSTRTSSRSRTRTGITSSSRPSRRRTIPAT